MSEGTASERRCILQGVVKKSHEISLSVEEGGRRVKGASRIQDPMGRWGRGAPSRMERKISTEEERKITTRGSKKPTKNHTLNYLKKKKKPIIHIIPCLNTKSFNELFSPGLMVLPPRAKDT